jgi:hypothetical protein
MNITKLSDKIMQVELHVGRYSGRKKDKDETEAVLAKHGAEKGAANVNKMIISKSCYKRIDTIDSQLASEHARLTLPIRRGVAALASSGYFNYTTIMNKLKNEREKAVDEFVTKLYPDELNNTQQRMGGLYKAEDYLQPHEVRPRFYCEIDISPLPDNSQLQKLVGIPDEEIEAIIADADSRAEERVKGMQKAAYMKLLEPVEKLAGILVKDEKVYATTFGAVESALELAHTFNVGDDPEFNNLVTNIRRSLTGYSINDVRRDRGAKKKAGRRAQAAMKEIEEAMAGYFPETKDSNAVATQ